MFRRSVFASSILAASISTAIAVPYGSFDARSLAMGNTSVATGSMSSAAFSNPALLVNNVSKDSFIISIGGGLTLLDNGGVIDTIDGFQGVEDELSPLISDANRIGTVLSDVTSVVTQINNLDQTDPANTVVLAGLLGELETAAGSYVQYVDGTTIVDPVATTAAITTDIEQVATSLVLLTNEQITDLNTLAGDSLLGKFGSGLMLGYAGDTYSFALSAQGNAYFSGGLTSNAQIDTLPESLVTDVVNAAQDPNQDINTVLGNPTGELVSIGAVTTEIGLSIASKLTVAGMNMAIGVKPKIVSAQAIDYSVNLENFNESDIADNTAEDLGSFTTFDAGVTLDVSDTFRVGLMGMNLISNELALASGYKVNFDSKLRIGAAYSNSFVTLTADMDLTETAPILFEDPSKMLAVGLELNAFNFVQLRFGYQDNMASGATTDPLMSAGIGLWLLGLDLQVAAVGNADSAGVFVQTGVRF